MLETGGSWGAFSQSRECSYFSKILYCTIRNIQFILLPVLLVFGLSVIAQDYIYFNFAFIYHVAFNN